jgi:hypothetical protein
LAQTGAFVNALLWQGVAAGGDNTAAALAPIKAFDELLAKYLPEANRVDAWL